MTNFISASRFPKRLSVHMITTPQMVPPQSLKVALHARFLHLSGTDDHRLLRHVPAHALCAESGKSHAVKGIAPLRDKKAAFPQTPESGFFMPGFFIPLGRSRPSVWAFLLLPWARATPPCGAHGRCRAWRRLWRSGARRPPGRSCPPTCSSAGWPRT